MTVTRNVLFMIIAVVLFLVALIVVLFVNAPDAKLLPALTFGGLASFALGHV